MLIIILVKKWIIKKNISLQIIADATNKVVVDVDVDVVVRVVVVDVDEVDVVEVVVGGTIEKLFFKFLKLLKITNRHYQNLLKKERLQILMV
jgi:hypothetical protein